MKLSYAWFPPIIDGVNSRIQLGVSGWWFFSWRKDLFVKYVFANNIEITVQVLLPWWLPIVDWYRKAGSSQNVTDCVVEDGTCIEVDFCGTLKLENCCWATDSVFCWDWLYDCKRYGQVSWEPRDLRWQCYPQLKSGFGVNLQLKQAFLCYVLFLKLSCVEYLVMV